MKTSRSPLSRRSLLVQGATALGVCVGWRILTPAERARALEVAAARGFGAGAYGAGPYGIDTTTVLLPFIAR